MKFWLLFLISIASFSVSISQVRVEGYFRKDGTYVEPHYRSSPDGNPYNNYSFPGNYNPYTGKIAGGNVETYLANYYKLYKSTDYYSTTFVNYTIALNHTNYKGLSGLNNYIIRDNAKNQIATIVYQFGNVYSIRDNDNQEIGTVIMTKKNRKYIVLDHFGYLANSNNNSNSNVLNAITWIFSIGAAIGLGALLAV